MTGREAQIAFLSASLADAVDDARGAAAGDHPFRRLRRDPRGGAADGDRCGKAGFSSSNGYRGDDGHRTERPVLHGGPDRRERFVRKVIGRAEDLDLCLRPRSPSEQGRPGQNTQAERYPGDVAGLCPISTRHWPYRSPC
jgi:hypothetical protein